MTPPRWRPLPSLVGLDARIRGVSHEARGVYLLLVCASDVDGVVRYAGPVRHALDALAGAGASATFDELVDGQLLELDGEGEMILPDVPRWQAEHAPRSAPAPVAAPERRQASDSAPALDRRAVANRLASRFSEKKLKTPEARAAWLESEAGRKYLEGASIPLDLALSIATGAPCHDAATVGATVATDAATVCHGVAPRSATVGATVGFPPVPPSGEKRAETEGEERPREGATVRATTSPRSATVGATPRATANATVGATERSGPRHGALPQSPSPSLISPSEGDTRSIDEVLHDLAQASSGGLSVSGSVDQREAVVTALRAAGVDLNAVGLALRSPAEVWPRWDRVVSQRTISVAMLAGKAPFECAGVAELVAFVRAQGAAPVDHGGTVIPTLEETEARVARERADRARILAGPPVVFPKWRNTAPVTETKEVAGG